MSVCSSAECNAPRVVSVTVTAVRTVTHRWPPDGFEGHLDIGWCAAHAEVAATGIVEVVNAQGVPVTVTPPG